MTDIHINIKKKRCVISYAKTTVTIPKSSTDTTKSFNTIKNIEACGIEIVKLGK